MTADEIKAAARDQLAEQVRRAQEAARAAQQAAVQAKYERDRILTARR